VRAQCLLLLFLAAAGCSRPPAADTFTAEPLSAAFAVLRSPNGQRQVLLVRTGTRWQGHYDDTFTNAAGFVFADTDDGDVPEVVHPADPAGGSFEIAGWRQRRDMPVIIVESWAAGNPSLRASGPSALVSMLRIAGDSPAAASINTALAAEFEGAVGLAAPVGQPLTDPSTVAARVAVEAAVRAVVDGESGEFHANSRMAVFQIPVFLNHRFIAVEHHIFEDNDGLAGGREHSRFTLHNLETGESPDPDVLIELPMLARLARMADSQTTPSGWYPARPGIVLVFAAEGARLVVPWRDALPVLPEDSPLRAVAESVH
jgi:hypothetical protein